MSDLYGDRLSAFIDGELDESTAADVAAHLRSCADCAHVIADLNRLKTWARSTSAPPATSDPWPRLRRRIRIRRWRWPVLAAASIGGLIVSISIDPGPAQTDLISSVPAPAVRVDATDLAQLLVAHRQQLDPRTQASLEKSLKEIDAALAEAERALQQDPASALLRQQLISARARRDRFVATAVALVRTEL